MGTLPASRKKTRILFFSEAVTLAHVARPVVLAQSLDSSCFDVHFAHAPRYRHLLGELGFTEHAIESIPPQQFLAALDKGKPLYDFPTLVGYVEEDLRLIAEIQPDIVVGDFRLSLAVSAELAGVPYVTISNACWSPYTRQRYTVPELPLTRILGPRLGQWVFSLGRPIGFALHCVPMHRLRRRYGLKSLGFDLREVYTHADYTLYADIPGLYDMQSLPLNHKLIGPVIWSPRIPLPDWWQHLPQDRPFVYVTLGSSGKMSLLPGIIEALGQLDITALVATAGMDIPEDVPENVFCDRYLPGEEAVKLSSLVICNGGSPTTHQALSQAVPVLGLAVNLDQYLNMATLDQAGAGRLLRAGAFDASELAEGVMQLIADIHVRETVRRLSDRMTACDSLCEFNRIINTIRYKIGAHGLNSGRSAFPVEN